MQPRMFERFQASGIECQLCGHDGAVLHDISIGGAGLSMDDPVEVGAECQLKVQTEKERYILWGSVVWQRNEDAPGKKEHPYTVGLRFDKEVIESSKDLVFNLLSAA